MSLEFPELFRRQRLFYECGEERPKRDHRSRWYKGERNFWAFFGLHYIGLQAQFLASALGDGGQLCDRSDLNCSSSKTLNRKLHGIRFAVERLVDDRG